MKAFWHDGWVTFPVQRLMLTRTWENIKYLTNLRNVHFRYPRVPIANAPEEYRTHREIAIEFQQFANAFVEYLDNAAGICPKLKAVIIGACWHHGWQDEPELTLVPRHCFLKGHQTDPLRCRRPVAIPVSESELREVQSRSSVMDLDGENNWIGALPGRFHD